MLTKFAGRLALVSLTICGATACAKNDNDDGNASTRTLNGNAYVVVDGDLTATDASVAGTGVIAFSTPTAEDGKHFTLGFSLADGGELSLVTYADNKLAGGISVRVVRAGTALTGQLVGTGDPFDLTATLAGIDAAQPVTLAFDVHNDETPTHVVVWGDTDAEPRFNSEEAGAETHGNGSGRIYGLKLTNATVTSVVTSEPKFEE